MFSNNPRTIITTHENPLINIHSNPDPYAICHKGIYYVYTTGYYGVNVLRSKDMKTFEHMGFALSHDAYHSYWAPCVFFHDGIFYMYGSSVPAHETDPHLGYMRVATSDNPLGPFTYKKTLCDEFSIDPHVVEKDGQLYMFYSVNRMEGKIGTLTVLDKLIDPLTLEGKPRIVVAPSIEQEISTRNRLGDGRDWYTIEGGFYLEHGNIGFLMYSANCFTHEDYFVGYSICDAGSSLDDAVFGKHPSDKAYRPLIGKDKYFTGCGHNSMITGPSGELLIVYHGRPKHDTAPVSDMGDDRRLCVSAVEFHGKELRLVPYV